MKYPASNARALLGFWFKDAKAQGAVAREGLEGLGGLWNGTEGAVRPKWNGTKHRSEAEPRKARPPAAKEMLPLNDKTELADGGRAQKNKKELKNF